MMEVANKLFISSRNFRLVDLLPLFVVPLLAAIFLVYNSQFEENKCVDHCKQKYVELSTGLSTYTHHINHFSKSLMAAAVISSISSLQTT